MVSVSLALAFGSATVTRENGSIGASDVVGCPASVPDMLGATAGSWLITVVVLSTADVASALLASVSVKVVFELVLGWPTLGVNTSARNSSLTAVAVPAIV